MHVIINVKDFVVNGNSEDIVCNFISLNTSLIKIVSATYGYLNRAYSILHY